MTIPLAGAGGDWPRFNETDDPSIEAQITRDSCGPACARIVWRALNAFPLPTHEELYERTGRTACNARALATAMNECESIPIGGGNCWQGEFLDPPGDDFRALLDLLADYTPWIAHLREPLVSLGHFLVVDTIGSHEVTVLDPWHPGTRYVMSLDSFADYWCLEVVWCRRIRL